MFILLRIVDVDRRLSMGFVYRILEDAKKNEIKTACNWKETAFRPIIEIIERNPSADSIAHCICYYIIWISIITIEIKQYKTTHLLDLQPCIAFIYSILRVTFKIRLVHMNSSCTRRDLWKVKWRLGIEWVLIAWIISIHITFTFKI